MDVLSIARTLAAGYSLVAPDSSFTVTDPSEVGFTTWPDARPLSPSGTQTHAF